MYNVSPTLDMQSNQPVRVQEYKQSAWVVDDREKVGLVVVVAVAVAVAVAAAVVDVVVLVVGVKMLQVVDLTEPDVVLTG